MFDPTPRSVLATLFYGPFFRWFALGSCCFVCLAVAEEVQSLPVSTEELAAHVLVVYNSEYSGSKTLAEEYAASRGISAERLFGVKGGIREGISRSDFERFIRAPLLKHVQTEGWLVARPDEKGTPVTVKNDIWMVVLMQGIPLRINGTPLPRGLSSTASVQQGTVAAVDSELACLPLFDYPLRGALNNPFYRKDESIDGTTSLRMVLVCRLDAPDIAQVRRMMTDALGAEARGLSGRAYIDARGLKQGGYLVGDEWMRGAYDLLWEGGFEVEKDESPLVLRKSFPMTDAAFYAGWYSSPSGPFVRESGFRMLPGAVAYHIISNSGITIRPAFSSRTSWIIKLIEAGAACTMGAVAEPFLTMTPNVDVFTQRLLQGYTFGEAAYQSTPTLSWQMTMVGDPLYRPFGQDPNRLLALAKARGEDATWASIRCLNLLFRAGNREGALALCSELGGQAAGRAKMIYEEKRAQFLLEMEHYPEAVDAWKLLADQQQDDDLSRRAALRLWQIGEVQGDDRARFEAMDACIERFPDDDFGEVWMKRLLELAGRYGTDAQKKYYEKRVAEAE